jgi:hypothetical protein
MVILPNRLFKMYKRTPRVGFEKKPEMPCKGLDKYKITNLFNTSQITFPCILQKAKVNFILSPDRCLTV